MDTEPQMQLRKRLEKHMAELPSLPTVVSQFMTLDRQDDSYFDKLLTILESDPNLSSRVLASANSAASGSRAPITTLRLALGRVGSQAVSNMVLAMSMTSVFVPRDEWEKSLWRHAVQVATAARELALRSLDVEIDPDEAYACGLLHDIGRFIMFQEAPDQLREIDEADWDEPEGLLERERSICGLTHPDLGALVCRRWGIPETIAQVVQEHHGRPDGRLAKLTALIQIADIAMFPSAMPGAPELKDAGDKVLRDTVQLRLPPFIQLDVPELRKLLQIVAKKAHTATEALGVA